MHLDWVTAEPGILFIESSGRPWVTAVSMPHWCWEPRIVSAEPLGDDVYLQRVCYDYSRQPGQTMNQALRARSAPESLAEFFLRGTEVRRQQNPYTGLVDLRLLTWALAIPSARLPRSLLQPLWADSTDSTGFACHERDVWLSLWADAQKILGPRLLGVSRALDPVPSLQAPAKFWQHLGRAKNRR